MSHDLQQLLEQLRDTPEDWELRLVISDELEFLGDPRFDLVRTHARLHMTVAGVEDNWHNLRNTPLVKAFRKARRTVSWFTDDERRGLELVAARMPRTNITEYVSAWSSLRLFRNIVHENAVHPGLSRISELLTTLDVSMAERTQDVFVLHRESRGRLTIRRDKAGPWVVYRGGTNSLAGSHATWIDALAAGLSHAHELNPLGGYQLGLPWPITAELDRHLAHGGLTDEQRQSITAANRREELYGGDW